MHGARQPTATATYRPADATSRGMGNTRDTQREASTRTAQPFVDQLRFARSEFGPCLVDGSDEDAVTCLLPMNSLGWIICHLAGQERHFWFTWAQGITDVAPELNEEGTFEKPANTPPLKGAWAAWQTVTQAVDPFLDAVVAFVSNRHAWADPDGFGPRLTRVVNATLAALTGS